MKKKTMDIVVNGGSIAFAVACVASGQCQLAVPVMAGASAYNGVDLIKEYKAKKGKNH